MAKAKEEEQTLEELFAGLEEVLGAMALSQGNESVKVL